MSKWKKISRRYIHTWENNIGTHQLTSFLRNFTKYSLSFVSCNCGQVQGLLCIFFMIVFEFLGVNCCCVVKNGWFCVLKDLFFCCGPSFLGILYYTRDTTPTHSCVYWWIDFIMSVKFHSSKALQKYSRSFLYS